MRESTKATSPRWSRRFARELLARAVRGEQPAIRRLQAALGRAGNSELVPQPLVVTVLEFGAFYDDHPDAPAAAPPPPTVPAQARPTDGAHRSRAAGDLASPMRAGS